MTMDHAFMGPGRRACSSWRAASRGLVRDSRSPTKGAERLIPEVWESWRVLIREISRTPLFMSTVPCRKRQAYSGTTLDARQDALHGGVKQHKPRRLQRYGYNHHRFGATKSALQNGD